MDELLKRIGQVEKAADAAYDCVERHGKNGLSSLDNLKRLVTDLKDWAEHMECANESGAIPVRSHDGQIKYVRA